MDKKIVKDNMFDLKALQAAKKIAATNQESSIKKKADEFQQKLTLAQEKLFIFSDTHNELALKESSNIFFQLLEIDKTRIEPYFYLSCIFYFFDELKKAREYYLKAEKMNPGYEGLDEIKKLLFTSN